MTIVHLAGITPNGLIAALMVCGGLTKVKLHKAFKSMMPPHMLKNVEARGCIFQWIDKPFKVLFIFLSACLCGLCLSMLLNPCVLTGFPALYLEIPLVLQLCKTGY
jgi:hypothetical protein